MIQKLIPKTAEGRRPQIKMTPIYITVHSTGNPFSTALNEASNVVNNNPEKQVSFHVVVDENEAYQTLPFNEVGWHAGDGLRDGNMRSIGVEICEGGNRLKTLNNAINVISGIMATQNINIEHVVQHNHWSGKDCPRILRNRLFVRGGLDWAWFIKELGGRDMTFSEALQVLIKNGIIGSPEYWSMCDKTTKHIDELVINMAEFIHRT